MSPNQDLLRNLLGLDEPNVSKIESPTVDQPLTSADKQLAPTLKTLLLDDSAAHSFLSAQRTSGSASPRRKRGPTKHTYVHVELPFDLKVKPASSLEVLDRAESIRQAMENARLRGQRLLNVQIAESAGVDQSTISVYVKIGEKLRPFIKQSIRENWDKFPPQTLMQQVKHHKSKRGPKGWKSLEAWVEQVIEFGSPKTQPRRKNPTKEQLLKMSASRFSMRNQKEIAEAKLQEVVEQLNIQTDTDSISQQVRMNRALAQENAKLKRQLDSRQIEPKGIQVKQLSGDEEYIKTTLESYLQIKIEIDPSACFIAMHCRTDDVLEDIFTRIIKIHSQLMVEASLPANFKAIMLHANDSTDFKRVLSLLLDKALGRKL